MKAHVLFFFVWCLMTCCLSLNEKVEITSEYVINENWNKRGEETGGNSIEVIRMIVKEDSTINPFSDLNQSEILRKLVNDTSFQYVANVKIPATENYKNKKIFFNKDNGFDWWTEQGERSTRILGELQAGNWYQISRLSHLDYIVYIDSASIAHRFDINLANW